MNLASLTRIPGSARWALARINAGAAALDTRVLPLTPVAWAVFSFLTWPLMTLTLTTDVRIRK